MNVSWQPTKLAKVLTPVSRAEAVDPTKEYQLLGVRLEGRGPFLRETVLGSQSAATRLFKVEAGDFINSRLFAWSGAFGVIETDIDGCYVSGEFPTFQPVPGKIDTEFLRLWFRLPSTIEKVEADCTGSTPLTRHRFKENFFLSLEIPLPPLAEQRRILARVESLAVKIDNACSLRQQTLEEVEALFEQGRAKAFEGTKKHGQVSLESIATLERGKFSHRPRNDPRFFGGSHPWIQIAEIENSNKVICKWNETLNDDGLAISKKFPRGTVLVSIAATIGAVGILDFDCCVPDSIVGVIPRQLTDSEFLYHFLGYVRTHLENIAPQSAQKNINLQILAPLPVPELDFQEQRRIVVYLDGLQAKVDAL
jgi:type I restriction enzyme S subunit